MMQNIRYKDYVNCDSTEWSRDKYSFAENVMIEKSDKVRNRSREDDKDL
jgi:hypothetical protein